MELRQLKQVLVLAETLNFHRAAERLHMAQPPLSTSIRKLEEELGVTLFDRLPSGLRLTPAGEVVLRNARRTLFFSDEVKRAAREGDAGEQGLLRLGFVGSATYSLMPQIIRSYRRQYPRVDLTIEESTTAELLRRLEEHSLDVALVRFPVLEPTDARLTLLQRDQFVLAVGTDSPLAARAEIALAALADEPFIMYSRTLVPSMHTLVTYALHEAGVTPRIAQQAVQVQTILSLVESGLGVALVPAAASKYAGNGVRLIALTDWPSRLTVGIALATLDDAVTATARNFIAVARTIVPEQPGGSAEALIPAGFPPS
ncbi:Regulatory protein, LysR:LysR, substrate-binding protein [Cupriavidus taiwanensis]|uniref:LysR family transcriptional regulator n=1 Tax=Cupriavidus taiwanensis TaxID=164546 RepID=UPI000E1B4975|nr:LysR family transcriptional regulator [Cupriavidus taiwanensis]SPA39634.1 Regulatory protein, LysR:LysR, substrate-binding protein [Cupriavidus taiwanensis]